VDLGLDVRLGDDEHVLGVQKGADLRRRRDRLVAAAHDTDGRIGQDAKSRHVGAHKLAALFAARVVVFANAEEGEVVVAQPFEKGERLVGGSLRDRQHLGLQFAHHGIQPAEHGAPVAHGGFHVFDDLGEVFLQLTGGLVCQIFQHDVDDAGPYRAVLRRSGGGAFDKLEIRPVVFHVDDRMHDEANMVRQVVDLAHHRVEQEGHVLVDDGNDAAIGRTGGRDAYHGRAAGMVGQRIGGLFD
jgi:hypothetical protein